MEKSARTPEMSSNIYNVYELLRQEAISEEARPGIGWPREDDPSKFDTYSVRQLYQESEAKAQWLTKNGFDVVSHNSTKTIGLLGPSDFIYATTLLALVRLGYTVLLVSPRMNSRQVGSILEQADCELLFFASSTSEVAHEVQRRDQIDLLPFSKTVPPASFMNGRTVPHLDTSLAQDKTAAIVHSSGSTGLPKIMRLSHGQILARNSPSLKKLRKDTSDLITSTLYHAAGFALLFIAISKRATSIYWNELLPYTNENLTQVLRSLRPHRVTLVPYAITCLAESDEGIQLLKNCTTVSSFGSRCPDSVGNMLTERGVNLTSYFGSSEGGLILVGDRDVINDTPWPYLAPFPALADHIMMQPEGDDTFELVLLADFPGCTVSTPGSVPSGSFRTRDLFEAHPTLQNRWKYIGRKDDAFKMGNGSYAMPLEYEGDIRRERLVKEALVFGVGRPELGLLLIRNQLSSHMADEEFVAAVWPAIEARNWRTFPPERVSRQMIVPVSADTVYPATDKGTFVRKAMYVKFEKEIEAAYNKGVQDMHH